VKFSIPDGFSDPTVSGFAGNNGPIYRREIEGNVLSGFLVEQRHCNPQRTCHGGWLSTFADVGQVRQGRLVASPLVTISLTVDYLDAAQLGEWVESRCEVARHTRSMVFLQEMASANGRPVLRMNGTFRIRHPES
jgi:acyl-coenzyme A thioesterase PaaI-like protein